MIPKVNKVLHDQTQLMQLFNKESETQDIKFLEQSEDITQLIGITQGMASISYYFLYGCVAVLVVLSSVIIYVISKLFNQNMVEQQEKMRLKKNNESNLKLVLDLEERIQRLTDNKITSVISKKANQNQTQAKFEQELEKLDQDKKWLKIELEKAQDTIRDNTNANLRLISDLNLANEQCQ